MKDSTHEKNIYSRSSIASNALWRILERCASEGVTIAVSVILLRLLSPPEYGVVAIITTIIMVLNVFLTSGLADSLIQKKDADNLDFSTLFWVNVGVAATLYTAMFILAPSIARFYELPELTALIRVLSLRLIITSVNSIQCAYVARNMLFKKYFISTLSSKIGSGVLGIAIALMGGGAWALVAQNLSLLLIETVIIWFRVRWRPEFRFSMDRARKLLGFGWKIMAYQFATTVSNQARSFIIGKKYSSEDLAFYSKGNQFPSAISSNLSTIVNSIIFPVLSHYQDDRALVKAHFRKALSLLTYCIFPLLIGLASISIQLVTFLYTEKWLNMVPYLRIACVTYMIFAMELPIRLLINSVGFSTVTMKVELSKCAFTLIVVAISMIYGVMTVAFSMIICELFTLTLYLIKANRIIQYTLIEYIHDIIPNLLISLCMGTCVLMISMIKTSTILSLCIQVMTGAFVYILLSKLFRIDSFIMVKRMLKQKQLRTYQE